MATTQVERPSVHETVQTREGNRVIAVGPTVALPRLSPAYPVVASETEGTGLRRRVADAFTDIHASNKAIATILVDLTVLWAVCLMVGVVPTWSAGPWAVAIVVAGYLGRLYGDRDSIQTRGVLWYPGKVVLPVALVAFGALAGHLMPVHAAIWLVPSAIGALCGVRLATWLGLAWMRRSGHGLNRAIVIGSGPSARTVMRKLSEFPEGGLTPVANISLEALETDGVLGRLLQLHRAQHVVIIPAHSDDIDLAQNLQRHRGLDARFSLVPPLGDLFLHPGRVSELGGVPFIPLGRVLRTRTSFPGKRTFDLVGALVLLAVLSPVMAAAAIAVKLCDGGPVFFRQRRVGKGGEVFDMLKFRSMVVGADKMQAALRFNNFSDGLLFRVQDDPRITRVGRVLRNLSVDELPQLWNVVRGQMSLVGPRPLAVDPDAFSAGDSERHTVLPGITGYWQISGGNGLAYQEMITLDLAYIRNWSLWLDVRLLLRTVPILVHRHDPA
jgi:exopolysaccharide biosynthesis polyprenyl glycosylphosphotransferase